MRPLGLGVGAGRTVVERRSLLAPTPGEGEPFEARGRSRRQQDDMGSHHGARCEGVVASEPGCCALPEPLRLCVVRRMRSRTRVDGDVSAFGVQLGIRPHRDLGSLVLCERHACRSLRKRRFRVRRVEQQLDHLPVAFMLVVPVVEYPEEPVLQHHDAGVVGVGRDPGIDRRGSSRCDAVEPLLVRAPGIERIAGKIEVPAFALARQIGRRRGCDRLPARPSQDHVRTTEHGADARRQVGLPRSARRRLSPHDDDGRVHLGETIGCCVVRRIGVRR